MGYASSLLKQYTDSKVRACDACALNLNEKDFLAEINRFSPDILVAEPPTISLPLMMELLKEAKGTTGCKLVVVGLHVTGLPNDTMKTYPFIDYAIVGEYESALKELVETEEKGDNSEKKISGIVFRHNGEVSVNSRSNPKIPFDAMPYPDRDDLPVELYHDFEIVGKPTVQMLTSRGCPYQCTFCNTTVFYPGGLYRARAIKNVVDEMEYVVEKYRARQIYFDDDLPFINRSRLQQLVEEILSRNLDIPWGSMGDINIDEESIRLISRAGCVGLKFGVESINSRALKAVNKKFITAEKTRNFVKACKKYRLWTHGTFIIGLPYDTRESILATLKFALELDMDSAQFYIAVPLPGTPFYDFVENNGWLVTKDWTMYDGNNYSVISYPWLSKDEIEELIRFVKGTWEKETIKKFMKSPYRMWRYVRARGLGYTLRKASALLITRKYGIAHPSYGWSIQSASED